MEKTIHTYGQMTSNKIIISINFIDYAKGGIDNYCSSGVRSNLVMAQQNRPRAQCMREI